MVEGAAVVLVEVGVVEVVEILLEVEVEVVDVVVADQVDVFFSVVFFSSVVEVVLGVHVVFGASHVEVDVVL